MRLDARTIFGTLMLMGDHNVPDENGPGQSIDFWEVVFY
jgi:hypothetical protein